MEYFKYSNETNTRQMNHYVIPMSVDEKPQTVVIRIGSNGITKFNHHDASINYLVNMIIQIGLKCRYYGVKSIAIQYVVVRNNNKHNRLVQQVNISYLNAIIVTETKLDDSFPKAQFCVDGFLYNTGYVEIEMGKGLRFMPEMTYLVKFWQNITFLNILNLLLLS